MFTELKTFDAVAFVGDERGRVLMFHPSFVQDKGTAVKQDAVPVEADRVILFGNRELDLHKYVFATSKPFIEGGDESYVSVRCIFDEVEKVWYVKK